MYWNFRYTFRLPRQSRKPLLQPKRWGRADCSEMTAPMYKLCPIPVGHVNRTSYRGADKSLARPGRKQAHVSLRMVWISFGALPCKKNKTWWQLASRCCWNRARRLTCFRACFLPGRAKDLSAPRYNQSTVLKSDVILGQIQNPIFWPSRPMPSPQTTHCLFQDGAMQEWQDWLTSAVNSAGGSTASVQPLLDERQETENSCHTAVYFEYNFNGKGTFNVCRRVDYPHCEWRRLWQSIWKFSPYPAKVENMVSS